MQARRVGRRGGAGIACLLLGVVAFPLLADAICDVIPGPTNQFRAALGAADRPFAGPGEFVDVKIRPQVCDKASLGLKDVSTPNGVGPEDVAVTVLFTPPGSAPRHAVVTATDCARLTSSVCVGGLSAGNLCTNDLQCLGGSCTGPSKLSACQAQLGPGGAASCVTATGPDLAVATTATEGHIRFRFPDTDALVGTSSDDRTLAGPATIAVSPLTAALPCGLASQRCAVAGGTIACVDELYAIDGTCSTQPAALDETFQHFTALPPPNNYEAVCDTPGTPCDGTATEVRFTTDASGNVLIPMDYRGVLVRLDDVPVPRLVRGETSVDAFAGPPLTPVAIPDAPNFLASYSPQGRKVPPLFTPLADPNAPASLTLFGSIDAPLGVIRIARKGPGTLTCSGGANAGSACTSDAQCPAADCALFEFRDRYDVGVGPVVLPDTLYAVGAESPVPIDGLSETPDLFAFVRSEALQNEDLNGDGDQTDPVLSLRDKGSGAVLPIGVSGTTGRAATRLREGRFSFPAVETDRDLVAYVEPEPLQGTCSVPLACDQTGDGDVADTVLRIFRVSGGMAAEVPFAAPHCVDPDSRLNGKSLAIANKRIFFRQRESDCAGHRFELLNTDANGLFIGHLRDLSADGSLAIIQGRPDWFRVFTDLFARDRAAQVTELLSGAANGALSNESSIEGMASRNGRFVAYRSLATDLSPGIPNDGLQHLFVHDRVDGTNAYVQTTHDGSPPNALVTLVGGISDDGRFVLFESEATNVLSPPTPVGELHLYLRDRVLGVTEMVERSNLTGERADRALSPSQVPMTPDARFIAFHSFATNLVPDDGLSVTWGNFQTYLRDRALGTTELVSRATNGDVAHLVGAAPTSFPVDITPDGRFVLFQSLAPNLVPGDTNDYYDLFVRDRKLVTTERVNISSEGRQGEGSLQLFQSIYARGRISDDGRFVAFNSDYSNLVPGDQSGSPDVFRYDRRTGLTEEVTALPFAGVVSAGLSNAFMSSDAQIVGFMTDSPLLGATPSVALVSVVREPDPSYESSDLDFDGRLAGTFLRVVDSTGATPQLRTIGPAGQVAVAGDVAAFLRPETAGAFSSVDLNGDGDLDDEVVTMWRAPARFPTNLGRAATEIAASESVIAARISERGDGVDYNSDGDLEDGVVAVATIGGGDSPVWIYVGPAGSGLQVKGTRVAFLESEAEQGADDLNGDGDALDQVVRLFDAATGTLRFAGPGALDFVLGDEVLAFRAYEPSQGGVDLNGDGDGLDAVMEVYDIVYDVARNSERAAAACDLEACDPRRPYRVEGPTVSFLLRELDQGESDLNGDGDAGDVLLEVFNARAAALGGVSLASLASMRKGVCSSSGDACSSDAECGGRSCFVPPGACSLDLGTSCTIGIPGLCGEGSFCWAPPGSPLAATCREEQGDCKSDVDCSSGAVCLDRAQSTQRIVPPTTQAAGDGFEAGAQVLASGGTCVELVAATCSVTSDCPAGAYCDSGQCKRSHGACGEDGGCLVGTCAPTLVTASSADVDGDRIPDAIDNCPSYPNVAQLDRDADGIGDACDAQTCGNGIREGNSATEAGVEECDDGDRIADAICDASCQLVANDCADGFDNDGDGKIDYGTGPTNDPSCQNELAFASESPQCDDGRDNDGDGLVDFPAETKCQNRFDNDELTDPTVGCGLLGVEPLILLAALMAGRRVTRRRVRSVEGD